MVRKLFQNKLWTSFVVHLKSSKLFLYKKLTFLKRIIKIVSNNPGSNWPQESIESIETRLYNFIFFDWKSVGRLSLVFFGFPWYSLVVHGFIWFWFSLVFHDFPWFRLVILFFLGFSGFLGFPRFFFGFQQFSVVLFWFSFVVLVFPSFPWFLAVSQVSSLLLVVFLLFSLVIPQFPKFSYVFLWFSMVSQSYLWCYVVFLCFVLSCRVQFCLHFV